MTNYLLRCLLIPLVLLWLPTTSWATLTIYTQTPINITLTGFDGLNNFPLFQGKITTENPQEIDTPYRGLALLGFAGGQSYPVIIGEAPFVLQITSPGTPPSFADSGENEFLYRSLAGHEAASDKAYPFANVLLAARSLLESTYPITTMAQLTAKKNELTGFVTQNFQHLRHSDMVRRLMAQSLMMHEYVSYHAEREPATAIQQQYQQEVTGAVSGWLKALSPYIPADEIINASVACYYDRSMVTMASLIIDHFPDEAICPGEPDMTYPLPQDLRVTNAHGKQQGDVGRIKRQKNHRPCRR